MRRRFPPFLAPATAQGMTSNRPPVGVAEDALWRDRLKLEAGSEAWDSAFLAEQDAVSL